MPHSYSEALKNHLKQPRITVATRALITRKDGVQLGLTSHVKSLMIDGVKHWSSPGLITSALVAKSNLEVDNATLQSFMTPVVIDEHDLRSGVYDDAKCRFDIFNYNDLSMGLGYIGKGYLGNVRVCSDGTFTVEYRSVEQMLASEIGETTSVRCRNRGLANGTCPVNVSGNDASGHAITHIGTVSQVYEGDWGQWKNASLATLPQDFFRYGRIAWTSGYNAGFKGEVYSFAGGVFRSWQPFPFPVQVGDAYTAIEGCDLPFDTCCENFSNHNAPAMFNGEPWVQGEQMYRVSQR